MYYAGALSLLGLAAAAWVSVRLARADHEFRKNTPEGVARAVELMPRNAVYLSRRALQIDYDGGDAAPLLEKLAALTPTASAPRIRLGLNAEIQGNTGAAERWLLEAARVDRQFEPAWTLANFYFRQHKAPEFWTWIRAALDVSYGDRRPAFELCWNMSATGAEILERAIPDRREVVSAYVWYLLTTGRFGDLLPAALKLAGWHDSGELAALYAACDALLDAGQGDAALRIWTALGKPAPHGIVNPDLAPAEGRGFDWRRLAPEGVTHNANRISFSGQEPEFCELLRQFLTLRPGHSYRLQWEARTSGLPAASGLEWRVQDQRAGVAAHDDWLPGQFRFKARASYPVLSLEYQRPRGEPRAAGWIEIRRVTITELPE